MIVVAGLLGTSPVGASRATRPYDASALSISMVTDGLKNVAKLQAASHAASISVPSDAPQSVVRVPVSYVPAPIDTPPCFVGAENGHTLLSVEASPVTAAYDLAYNFGRPVWAEEVHRAVRTFEATICMNGNQPAGVVQDGFLALDELQHLEYLSGVCFGNPQPFLTSDLLLAMSGFLQCPVPGANITFGRPHIENQVRFAPELNVEVVKFIHAQRGPVRVQEALDISRCESSWDNLAQNPVSGGGSWLFQLIELHANPGNAIPNQGLVWDDMADPAYASIVALDIMTWFESEMAASYLPWKPSFHCHGHIY